MFRTRWPLAWVVRRLALASGVLGLAVGAALPLASSAASGAASCRLAGAGGTVSHVIYVQFDNVHFSRDNPNVPSDLEQMPHLLQFMQNNGVLLTNEHTPLLSHTADDLVTSISGLYGDRHGTPIANSYQVYNPNGSTTTSGSFAYWTDPVVSYHNKPSSSTDPLPTMVGPGGGNPPAPWVSYTRAGCNFGTVAMANTELENTQPDIAQVFGAGSAQAKEAISNPSLAATDFEGLAIHCAQGASPCAGNANAVADSLPNEPGGYSGYQALFGAKYVSPAISGGQATVTNLDGQPITDLSGNPGFPGYDGMQPVNSLAYTAALQEHGVPVTYTYISSAHENAAGPFAPGQSAYTAQLAAYDRAFARFFARLASDGITPANSVFVFASDENDHFVGPTPTPAGCDGITTPCNYSRFGEIDANVQGLLAAQGLTAPFDLHEDSAPAFYLHGQPAATDPTVRAFERASGALTVNNPYTGASDRLAAYLADPTELRLLHMITADPARTPSYVMFANPNYWVTAAGQHCASTCTSVNPYEAWNHGTVAPEVTTTWLGVVGAGVAPLGRTAAIWSDHTDIQPTLMALLGLRDDYTPQGRVLEEILQSGAQTAAASSADYTQLADVYKQIEAPLGQLAASTLQASTHGLDSNTANDQKYTSIDGQIADITARRDQLASQMINVLDGAAFGNEAISHRQAQQLEDQGNALIAQAQTLAAQN